MKAVLDERRVGSALLALLTPLAILSSIPWTLVYLFLEFLDLHIEFLLSYSFRRYLSCFFDMILKSFAFILSFFRISSKC